MDNMTAEQAAEAAKGLTFEKVWAVIIETQKSLQDTQKSLQETQKSVQETQKSVQDTQKSVQDTLQNTQRSVQETQNVMQETQRETNESFKKIEKTVEILSKNIGGLGNSLGKLTESIIGSELFKKFMEYGYMYKRQAPHIKYYDEDAKLIAEVDLFLENGDYAMLVEIKTELSIEDINEHLARIEKIRKYMDARDENRKLVGAVAGGTVSGNVLIYAQRKGLYVIIQNGDSASIAAVPQGFKAREW